MSDPFHQALIQLPDGAYDVMFERRRYLLRKTTLLDNRLIKLYAEELGGNDFISLNYYTSISEGLLKPCEMAVDKVRRFVLNLEHI